ncbi:DUF4232 domain-containing protein [Plantibacter sp. Mn2098]|uniref:DUF4232 domain-containing protein n=1 Tax=Plantibacter sp. Mn2098 TaxID=3395266 RepID=UPI003BEB9960
MRRRLLPALILPTVVGMLLLSGCADSGDSGGGATATASASPSPSSSVSASPSPSGTAGQVDPNAPAGQCADASIGVSVTEFDAGAGNISFDVAFTNTGSTSCVLRGTPGVSVVGDGNGTQLGKPARQNTAADPEEVQLAPGKLAHSVLTAVNIGTDGGPLDGCAPVAGDGYRVYPPHSFTAVFVASAGVPACSTDVVWMTVGSVQSEGF